MTEIHTPTDVGGINVEQCGAGPHVVLIHAGIADSRMWDPQWIAWAGSYRLTRVDLRGFGQSAAPAGQYCPAADVLAAMDSMGVERAVLVGASYGGLVALDIAGSSPDRVRGLVLVDAPLPEHAWSADMHAYSDAEEAAINAGDLDRAVQLNIDFWLASSSEAVREAIACQHRNALALQAGADADDVMLCSDLTAALKAMNVPTLVVAGANDVADFRAIAEELRTAITNATFAVIADACHLPSLEQPVAFDAVALPFLESVR